MNRVKTSLTLLIVACACGATFAQQETSPDARPANARNQPRQDMKWDQMLTKFFAAKLMLMNGSTIQMSELAREKSSTPEVKQFAAKLVEEHKQLNESLRKCAPELESLAIGEDVSTAAKTSPRDETSRKAATSKRPESDTRTEQQTVAAEGDRPALPWRQIVTIERKAADNFIQSSTRMLEKYEGQDFDMGFLGFQIGSHTWALAELKALDSVGTKEFQKIVSDSTQHTEQHLQEAQRLSKKFEDDNRRRGASTN